MLYCILALFDALFLAFRNFATSENQIKNEAMKSNCVIYTYAVRTVYITRGTPSCLFLFDWAMRRPRNVGASGKRQTPTFFTPLMW